MGFVVVGSIGFVTDGGVLTLLSLVFGLHPTLARGISFPIASLVTWFLNRQFVFVPPLGRSRWEEYGRYMTVQVVGAGSNLLVFAVLINIYPAFVSIPIAPLAIASIVGMVINYLGAKVVAFQ